MKAPAFQFYAGDYLADESVSLMSLEAEGAYIRLLAFCWREGSIPSNPGQLSRLCKGASSEIIEEVLGCFYDDPVNPGRMLHKRLEEERDKQEQHRAKQSENGKRGGRPPKANENPTKSQNKAVGFSGLSQTKAKKSSSSSSSISNNIKEGVFEGLNGAISEVQHTALNAKDKPKKDDAGREVFAAARKMYPGVKLGEETEWENFKKQHSKDVNFQDLPDTILKAIEAQERSRSALKQANRFVPEWPHFKTWINQRRWEQEIEAPAKQFPSIEPAKRIVNSKSLFGDLKPGVC